MSRDRPRDLVGCTAFLLLSLYAGFTAHGYGLWSQGEPASGLFPFMVSVALAAISVAGLVMALLRPAGGVERERREPRRVLLYGVALAAFALGWQPVGHVVTTAAVFLFLMRVVEHVSWHRALWVAAASAVGSWLLFERLLGVPLPHGMLR